jgi:hypothetical protein
MYWQEGYYRKPENYSDKRISGFQRLCMVPGVMFFLHHHYISTPERLMQE